jgi:ABC-2 type transport system permease protein
VNIFLQQMRMERKSLITWITSLVGLSLLFMLMYPPIAPDLNEFLKFMETLPAGMRNAIGAGNFRSGGLIGFYSLVLTYVLLAGSVQAMNLGVSVLSAEVRDKTADFLYAKPVSRHRIIAMKLAAVGCQLLITNLVYIPAALVILTMTRQAADIFDFKMYILLTSALAWLQLIFCCIGLAVSALLKRVRTVLPISMGVVFFFYVLFVLNQTLNNAELAFLTPFGYFELTKIMARGAYEPKFVLAASGVILVTLAISWRAYFKKDLPSI